MSLKGVLKKIRIHNAVYFAPLGLDDDGKRVFAEPRQLKVRWEEREVEFTAQDGKRTSKAVVYVGEVLEAKGVLWKGKLAQLEDPTDPYRNTRAWEIQALNATDDLRGKNTLRVVFL